MKPNEEQEKFILEELIPSILKDEGKCFAMSTWFCGKIGCIGGWIEVLKHPKVCPATIDDRTLGEYLGLSEAEANGLFYGYTCDWRRDNELYGWPKAYQDRYKAAETLLAKANVAADLLREIAAKGGEILYVGKVATE